MRRDQPFLKVDPYRDLPEEIRPLRSISPDLSAPLVAAVCEAASSIILSRPDGAATAATMPTGIGPFPGTLR